MIKKFIWHGAGALFGCRLTAISVLISRGRRGLSAVPALITGSLNSHERVCQPSKFHVYAKNSFRGKQFGGCPFKMFGFQIQYLRIM